MSSTPLTRARRRARYLAPTLALTAAGVMLATSLFLPYWKVRLVTASHPAGLQLVSYLHRVEGPLDDVLAGGAAARDARLRELSELERSLLVATATVISLLVVAATFVHNRWAALLALPAFVFPVIVVADTARWLQAIVRGADARVLETRPGAGLLLAAAASAAVVGGLWLHRRAYKPLRDAERAGVIDADDDTDDELTIRERARRVAL